MSDTAAAIVGIILGISLAFNALFAVVLVKDSQRWKQQRAKEIKDWDKRNGFTSVTMMT